MKHKKNLSALYRAVSGLPVDEQREAIKGLAKSLGLRVAAEYNADDDEAALQEWRKGLTPTDIAIVASLLCIPDWREKKARPSTVLSDTILELADRGVLLMVAMDEVSSSDGAKWRALVRKAHDALALGGRKRPRKHYKAMAAKSHAPGSKRRPSVEKRWAALPKKVQARWAQHWRDPSFSSALVAYEAMPDDIKSGIGSFESAKRLFKHRRPGDKSAGGRPRKLKPKT